MKKLKQRLLSAALTLAMLATSPLAMVKAAAEDTGKYVSEVFIAYGKTEDDARKWLVSHGWEPVGNDLNAGKLSFFDDNSVLDLVNSSDKVAAVMGIHRTNDPDDAITDMAVMNMSGGYSFKDYDLLVSEKQTEINEFVDTFLPVLEEYRDNYNGKGSAAGKARADLAHELLNRFYDGEIDGEYAMNDTGKPLGDLFLKETSRELGDSYASMAKNDKVEHADITQIILESSGPAVLAVEQALAMAADTSDDTWLERLSDISGVNLVSVVKDYVPGASKQNLSASAAKSLLQSEFGDAAVLLASGYDTVQQEIRWYEEYVETNGLEQGEDESDEDYKTRFNAYFEGLKQKDEKLYQEVNQRFSMASILDMLVYSVVYEGEWGETLGDFFNPEDGTNYGENTDNFLPFAAVLSEGQRSGLCFLSLTALLLSGAGDEESTKEALPEVQEMFGDLDTMSVYTGVNRAIFRGGVALTSQAKMRENMGKDAFGDAWYSNQILSITSYVSLGLGALMIGVGKQWVYASNKNLNVLLEGGDYATEVAKLNHKIANAESSLIIYQQSYKHNLEFISKINAGEELCGMNIEALTEDVEVDTMRFGQAKDKLAQGTQELEELESEVRSLNAGRVFMGIGGALMLAAAGYNVYKLYQFYQRDFTRIPMMIVDEADIVTYMTDENGNPILDANGKQKKSIEFDQFAYYDVVKCNRQEVGEIGDWQDGVSDYKKWGCGDAADLNCDCGKQWLAMYTIKSPAKGNPILAESLTYQTGSDAMPAGCTRGLHFFTYDYAMNIADEAYCFNNDKGGIYLFWKDDPKAYNTASTFTTGQLALAGIGGLAVGILGATAVLMMTKKKKETPDAPAAA